jgi:hypothetical protein
MDIIQQLILFDLFEPWISNIEFDLLSPTRVLKQVVCSNMYGKNYNKLCRCRLYRQRDSAPLKEFNGTHLPYCIGFCSDSAS